VAKEEYDTLKAWGLDKPQTRGNKERAEYWESMAKSLRRILAEKDIYIEQLENKIQILTGQYNDEQGT
jgi:lysozyme family protein|tara:strand:+ start:5569 stop:5772 length:204 start_codon:yes stop_codon:yes gene_type:complete